MMTEIAVTAKKALRNNRNEVILAAGERAYLTGYVTKDIVLVRIRGKAKALPRLWLDECGALPDVKS